MPEIEDLTERPLFAPTTNGHHPEEVVSGEVLEPKSAQDMRRDVAHRLQESILEHVRQMQTLWIVTAGELHRMQGTPDNRPWKDLGFETFDAWIDEQPFSRSWVYELASVYKTLVVDLAVPIERLSRIDASKVREILPAVRRRLVSLDVALADAEELSVLDLRSRYQRITRPATRQAELGTGYDATSEPVLVTCPTCRSRVAEDRIHLPAE